MKRVQPSGAGEREDATRRGTAPAPPPGLSTLGWQSEVDSDKEMEATVIGSMQPPRHGNIAVAVKEWHHAAVTLGMTTAGAPPDALVKAMERGRQRSRSRSRAGRSRASEAPPAVEADASVADEGTAELELGVFKLPEGEGGISPATKPPGTPLPRPGWIHRAVATSTLISLKGVNFELNSKLNSKPRIFVFKIVSFPFVFFAIWNRFVAGSDQCTLSRTWHGADGVCKKHGVILTLALLLIVLLIHAYTIAMAAFAALRHCLRALPILTVAENIVSALLPISYAWVGGSIYQVHPSYVVTRGMYISVLYGVTACIGMQTGVRASFWFEALLLVTCSVMRGASTVALVRSMGPGSTYAAYWGSEYSPPSAGVWIGAASCFVIFPATYTVCALLCHGSFASAEKQNKDRIGLHRMRWAIAHLAAWFFFLVFVCLFCYLIAVAGGSEKGSLPTPVVSIFSITFAAICAFLVRMSTTLANWSQEMLLNQVLPGPDVADILVMKTAARAVLPMSGPEQAPGAGTHDASGTQSSVPYGARARIKVTPTLSSAAAADAGMSNPSTTRGRGRTPHRESAGTSTDVAPENSSGMVLCQVSTVTLVAVELPGLKARRCEAHRRAPQLWTSRRCGSRVSLADGLRTSPRLHRRSRPRACRLWRCRRCCTSSTSPVRMPQPACRRPAPCARSSTLGRPPAR